MEPIETAFIETVRALGQDHLDNLVVVGGWCPFLYARHIWCRDVPELMTTDIDFAVQRMCPDRFSQSVYKKLVDAKLTPRRMDMDDDNRYQFAFVSDKQLIPVEFITAPHVLPNGQKSFRKPFVACDPVPEVAIALKAKPLVHPLVIGRETIRIQITPPAAFILMKAQLLEHRINTRKIPKDLASIAFVMRYCPSKATLLEEVKALCKQPEVRAAAKSLTKTLAKEQRTGHPWLRPFFEMWGTKPEEVKREIQLTFASLLQTLNDNLHGLTK